MPGLGVVVRVSIFDVVPHRKSATGVGVPEQTTGDGARVRRAAATKTWIGRSTMAACC